VPNLNFGLLGTRTASYGTLFKCRSRKVSKLATVSSSVFMIKVGHKVARVKRFGIGKTLTNFTVSV
jgi:hypothetical protein